MRRWQGVRDRPAKQIEDEHKDDPGRQANDKAARKGMGNRSKIKPVNVLAQVWCHAAKDESREIERSRGEAPQRQDKGWMRQRPRHLSGDLFGDNLQNERSN